MDTNNQARKGPARKGPARKGAAGYLFVLPWAISVPGGVNEVVKNLYRNLAAGNVFRPLLFLNIWDPAPDDAGDWASITFPLRSPWEAHQPVRSLLGFLFHLPRTLRLLSRLLKERDVQIINPHFPGLPCLHFLLLRWLGLFSGTIILSFHGFDVTAADRSRGIERMLWKLLLRRSDAVAACSDHIASRLFAFDPKIKPQLHTIHNGLDFEYFLSERSGTSTLPVNLDGKVVILNIGTFEPEKGQDVLIRAFRSILSSHPNTHLVLIGSMRPTSQATRDLIASEGLSEQVSMLEDVPHPMIPLWMKRADLFVLPSRVEPFGIVLLEAAACRKPVVATRVGGIPEVISDGVTGRLVPPDDAVSLAHAINDMLESPQERQRLADNLHQHAKNRFTWSQAAATYIQLCEGLKTRS
jgi:glycosyltransferase involved in cell wall biosynthesis